MERALYITNYRNIGFGESARIVLNHSLERGKMGDLVVVIGANNSGKSNVLDAICAFGDNKFSPIDCTTLSFEERYQHPQLSLVCKTDSCEYTYRLTHGHENAPYVKYPEADKSSANNPNNSFNVPAIVEDLDTLKEMYAQRGLPISVQRCNELITALSNPSINDNFIVEKIQNYSRDIQGRRNNSEQVAWKRFVINHPNSYVTKIASGDIEKIPASGIDAAFSLKFGYAFFPKIVKYSDQTIGNQHLSSMYREIGNNNFFVTLFRQIGISLEEVKNTYAAFTTHKNRGVLNTLQKNINKKLEKIAQDFNNLYFAENDQYSFEVTLESETIFFVLNRGTRDISLDHQSTGFRWFFNLYFNLLCKNELQPGDIIVMDQPGMDLHIKGREELRRFLKEFARRNDLTIVIATHEPSMIDLDCLDEIRVVSMKDNQSSICNDFAAVDPDDPDCLKPIKEALTVENRILFDPDMNLVFVEGITDYNYLLAFKKLLGFKNLSFLPIKGVGDIKDADIAETQKSISRELIRLKKNNPILLVDSDKAGQSIKEINSQDSCLRVCTLADIDPAFKFIESLFDPEDLKKLGLVDENGKYVKHPSDSAVIKNHIESYELSETTKENFKKVLQHLDD